MRARGGWMGSHRREAIALTGAVTALLLLASPAGAATWVVTASPNLTQFDNVLWGADALSTSSAWAVGHADTGTAPTRRPQIQRWNGSSWAVVSSPVPTGGGELRDVDAVSSSSAWAVGFTQTSNGNNTLTERWNGASWSVVPSPNRSTLNYLMSVKAFSANDAFAVGSNNVPGTLRFATLVQRWNGSSWTIMPSPSPDPFESHLLDVDGLSASDLWAVGYTQNHPDGVRQSLVLHFNGSSWTRVPTPTAREASLEGVVALGRTNVWAVGWEFSFELLRHVPYSLHWNGVSWRKVAMPTPSAEGGQLYDVVVTSPSTLMAVGQAWASQSIRSLAMRWTGTRWSLESTPSPSTVNYLWDAASAAGTVFAVGQRQQVAGGVLGPSRTLVLRGQTGNG